MYHNEHLKMLHQPLATPLSRNTPLHHHQIVNMDSLSYLRKISVYLLPPSPSITLPPHALQLPPPLSQLQLTLPPHCLLALRYTNPILQLYKIRGPSLTSVMRIWKLLQESELHRSQECLFGSSLWTLEVEKSAYKIHISLHFRRTHGQAMQEN